MYRCLSTGIVYVDRDGRFFRRGTTIEVDIYIPRQQDVPNRGEVLRPSKRPRFMNRVEAVEKLLGRRADRVILVAINIEKEALERAKELGTDVIYGAAAE
jgi:hypothetical protein